jgi:hypothetical protein
MARLASIGFETGNLSELVSSGGGIAVASTWADGGTYSLAISGSAKYGVIYDGAAMSEFYMAFAFRHNGASVLGDGALVRWLNSTTQLGLVSVQVTTHKIVVKVGTSEVAVSTSALSNLNAKYVVSLHVKIAEAPDGIIEVKIDGQPFVNFAGDTKPDANTGATRITIGTSVPNLTFNSNTYVDSILLNDTTGPGPDNTWPDYAPLYPIFPTGNGTYSQMTGSDGNQVDNYQMVDDVPSDGDTTYVKATAADLLDSYTITPPTIPEGATINAVIVKARPRKTNAAVDTQVAIGLRSGGVDTVGGDRVLPTAYGQVIQERFTLDPSDSQAWTPEKLAALELLIKSRGAYA